MNIDITERKEAEQRIRYLAHHDILTGLPNRVLLQCRLQQALAIAKQGGATTGLLLLDLDRFKDLNDTLGHPAGDRLLRAVVERLVVVIRSGDTLARLGGDEFAIVLPGLRGAEEAIPLAQRLLDTLSAPFVLEAQEVYISASAGIAIFDRDCTHADELFRQADMALYRAKQDGRGRFRFFEPMMGADLRVRQTLERDLRRGIERNEFTLYYQPQFDLRTGRVGCVEALVRWNHPERGLMGPDLFIPVAESSGLIRSIGAWVLNEACRQARRWQNKGLQVAMAVNLSPAQLRLDTLLNDIDAALGVSGLDPCGLELEITESLLLEQQSESTTHRTLRALASRGIRLALDDFGTGYSSLTAVKRLPVTKIKADRSFVQEIGRDPENEALVHAIVGLGQALGKPVVAEGVENEEQLAFLRRLNCDAAQGFHLARPQMAVHVEQLLRAKHQASSPPISTALATSKEGLEQDGISSIQSCSAKPLFESVIHLSGDRAFNDHALDGDPRLPRQLLNHHPSASALVK